MLAPAGGLLKGLGTWRDSLCAGCRAIVNFSQKKGVARDFLDTRFCRPCAAKIQTFGEVNDISKPNLTHSRGQINCRTRLVKTRTEGLTSCTRPFPSSPSFLPDLDLSARY